MKVLCKVKIDPSRHSFMKPYNVPMMIDVERSSLIMIAVRKYVRENYGPENGCELLEYLPQNRKANF